MPGQRGPTPTRLLVGGISLLILIGVFVFIFGIFSWAIWVLLPPARFGVVLFALVLFSTAAFGWATQSAGRASSRGRTPKPSSDLGATFRIENFKGGLSGYPSPQREGFLVLPSANRWEFSFTGTPQRLAGKLTRFTFEVTGTGPKSCHVAMQDAHEPTNSTEFDLPKTAASVAQQALTSRRFAIRNYDGGLPLDRKPHRDGTFVLTAGGGWQLHFVLTRRWLYGPCAGYRFEVTATAPSSSRVTMRSVGDSGVAASFELPEDSADDVRQCLPAPVPRESQAAPASGTPEPTPLLTGSAPSTLEQIRQLAEMRDSGILTEAEFEAKKTELLSRL